MFQTLRTYVFNLKDMRSQVGGHTVHTIRSDVRKNQDICLYA